MHQARLMSRVEGVADLRDDRRRLPRLQTAASLNLGARIGAFDPPHGDIKSAILLARPIHGQQMRMLDPRRKASLTPEPAAEVRVTGEFRCDHLDSDWPGELDVGG